MVVNFVVVVVQRLVVVGVVVLVGVLALVVDFRQVMRTSPPVLAHRATVPLCLCHPLDSERVWNRDFLSYDDDDNDDVDDDDVFYGCYYLHTSRN